MAALLHTRKWPPPDLRLATVDVETGERMALDRTARVDLLDAVLASGAVPGVWPLPLIDGRRCMDGGTYSIDNVDLAEGAERILLLTLRPGKSRICAVSLEEGVSAVRRKGARLEVVLPDETTEEAFASVSHNVLDPAVRPGAAYAGRAQGLALASSLAGCFLDPDAERVPIKNDQSQKSEGVQQIRGKIKKIAGKVLGNERMEAEDKGEELRGEARQKANDKE